MWAKLDESTCRWLRHPLPAAGDMQPHMAVASSESVLSRLHLFALLPSIFFCTVAGSVADLTQPSTFRRVRRVFHCSYFYWPFSVSSFRPSLNNLPSHFASASIAENNQKRCTFMALNPCPSKRVEILPLKKRRETCTVGGHCSFLAVVSCWSHGVLEIKHASKVHNSHSVLS